jgi:hypothetical protein
MYLFATIIWLYMYCYSTVIMNLIRQLYNPLSNKLNFAFQIGSSKISWFYVFSPILITFFCQILQWFLFIFYPQFSGLDVRTYTFCTLLHSGCYSCCVGWETGTGCSCCPSILLQRSHWSEGIQFILYPLAELMT